MALKDVGGAYRGVLRPVRTEDALQCEVCQGWFVPDETNFGCPWCALQIELHEAFNTHDPA